MLQGSSRVLGKLILLLGIQRKLRLGWCKLRSHLELPCKPLFCKREVSGDISISTRTSARKERLKRGIQNRLDYLALSMT